MSNANYDNPTDLQIGARGTFDGRQFIVKGRVVLGMELDGETYYWNEFNLVDESGSAVTLVHEATDDGYIWKLFQLYEPLRPLSVAEATAKRAGDTVSFEGRPINISLVDQSRVYHIEGLAPEGVEVGDVANYFNADAGERVLVASWTGDEIEFYEGRDLAAGRVEQAFGLSDGRTESVAAKLTEGFRSGEEGGMGFDARTLVTVGGLALCILAALFSCGRNNRQRPGQAQSPPPTPVVRLSENMRGTLSGRSFTIAGRALVEIARQGGNYDEQVFDLTDATDSHFLLVNGLRGNVHEWHLFEAAAVPEELTPYSGAALRQGRPATIAGRTMQVTQVFQSRVLSTNGQFEPAVWPAGLRYGLLAQANDEWFVAHWTETNNRLYTGRAVPESKVRAAFVSVESKVAEQRQ